MKTNKPLALYSLLFLFAIAVTANLSCKKDRIETSTRQYSSIDSYLDSKKQQEQEFLVTGTGTAPIIGNQGTEIYENVDCLVDANGDSVDYPYTIKLVELYTPADMIYAQMPTVSQERILETGGEIRLRAFKGSEELRLKANCNWTVNMPNANPKPYMTIFEGEDIGTFVEWTDTQVAIDGDTINNRYQLPLGTVPGSVGATLGWINCDVFPATSATERLTFTSTTDNLNNVGIFLYYPAYGGIMQVYNQTSGLIPNGSNVEIIIIAQESGGQLYSYTSSFTVNLTQTLTVSLSPTTDAAFTAYLNGLN